MKHAARPLLASTILLAACGGGGDGTAPPPPVDNSVSRIDLAPAGTTSLASGGSTTLTATAYTKDNRPLGASGMSWASSNDGVATVVGGVVTARLVGTATITATSGSATSAGVNVTVVAGAPTQVGIRTQPDGAASGVILTSQPVVEIRDAAGNLVTSSSASVTAALGSGSGTLSGTTTVATSGGVATFNDLAITGLIGARALVFAASGLTPATSASFSLGAGVATQLVLRTQPVAGTAYAPFPTPAAVEIRDALGNLTSSTALVTATLASGGGTLGGSTAINGVAGVATFSSLTVNGTAGARTLAFASGALPAVTSGSFSVATAPPAVIDFSSSTANINATVGLNPAAASVTITNTGVIPLTNLRVQGITYSPVAPAGWLAASLTSGVNAPATLRLTATSAALGPATYMATVDVAGDGAATTASLTVRLTVSLPTVNTYGSTANKVSFVTIGSSFSPGLVTTTGGVVTTPDPTIVYVARSPAIATVDAAGRVSAVAQGQAWIAATSTQNNSDSVLVIVPRSTGPVVRTDITRFNYRVGDTITLRVQIDTRGASVGAITATLSWPVYSGPNGTFGTIRFIDISTTGSPMSPVSTVDQSVNVIRINGVSASGVSGVVQLAVVRFVVNGSGLTGLYLNASELLGADFTNLLPVTTLTQYPIIVP